MSDARLQPFYPVRVYPVRGRVATRLAVACIAILGLAACGGGGSGGGTLASGGPSPGGIDRSGNSVGTVSGFGSVFVNGIEYDTAGATIVKDGATVQERDLRVGQVVVVTGTRNADGVRGTATRIVFDDNVEGPISVLDPANNRLVVLGQTVIVDDATVFDDSIVGRSLAGLAVGQVVEISGFVDASGQLRATRIEPKAAGGELELRGVISALDTGNRRFTIGTQQVDYANATLADFDGASIANGQNVEVKGTTITNGVLVATRVERESASLLASNGQTTELEGFVTRFASATDFDVSGQRVRTNASTTYRDGTSATLALGVKVEVEGSIESGVLVAREVQFKLTSGASRVTGRVQSVDATARRLTVLGVVVSVNAATQFEDNSNRRVSPFAIANITVDDYVEVRGGAGTGDVDIVATRVERDDADSDSKVRGAVETFNDPTIVVLGVTSTVGDGTRFFDRNGNSVTRAAFFSALRAGDRLEIEGGATGTAAIAAEEVQYED